MPLASLLWVAWGTGWLAETQVAVLTESASVIAPDANLHSTGSAEATGSLA
jgi:hypothetical protein